MKVIPTYGRFRLRPVTVHTRVLPFDTAFGQLREAVKRCGYRYWFPETAEATPPPDKRQWWDDFDTRLHEVEREAAGKHRMKPALQLRGYHDAVSAAFAEYLGMEDSWSFELRVSPTVAAFGFTGVSEQPFCDSTCAYCEVAMSIVTGRSGARLFYTPPSWSHTHPRQLSDFEWRMPDGRRGTLDELLGSGDRNSDDRRSKARRSRVKRMAAIHPALADMRMPG